MCFEDIKLGREKRTAPTFFINPGGSVINIPANPDRVTLTICPPSAGRITLLPPGADTSKTTGFNITNNGYPLILKIEDVGDIVTKSWTLTDDGLAHDMCWIETFLMRHQ